MNEIIKAIGDFLGTTGIAKMFSAESTTAWWQYLIMYVIIGTLFYLAIVKKFEPLLLMPIAFGMLLANLPGAELIHLDFFFDGHYFEVIEGELQGTISASVQAFLDKCMEMNKELHSLMVLRHGKVACEVYREPFNKNFDAYVVGIGREGALIVEKIDGTLEKVISGECIIKN